MRPRDPREAGAGLLFLAIGALGAWGSLAHDRGTARDIGPGLVPQALFLLMALLGLVIALRGLTGAPREGTRIVWRPLLLVLGGTAAFAALVRTGGLVAATLAMVPLASFADREARWGEALLAAAALAAFGVLVFVVGLGVPVPVWPWSAR